LSTEQPGLQRFVLVEVAVAGEMEDIAKSQQLKNAIGYGLWSRTDVHSLAGESARYFAAFERAKEQISRRIACHS
jgi:hypothetical protein